MSLLQRKLARDLLRLWSQVLTIALVVASAVGALLTTQACVHSLESARDRFYAQAHMADVFASVRRAPRLALPQFESLEGVALVQATVERPARLILPGVDEPVMGHLIGVSERRPMVLNQVMLREPSAPMNGDQAGVRPGLWPGAPQGDGLVPAWISEGFAQARGLKPGDRLQALINGRLRPLQITALALAPDVVFAGAMGMPDPAGYGVLWIDEDTLSAAWDLEGAFTRLALRLAPGADEAAVISALQSLLPRWGGRDAVARPFQPSHQMLDNEIQEQRLLGTVLPLVFAGVSVFLLHIVMTRLMATQRESIAALKALGFSNATLVLHQMQLSLVMAFIGWMLGAVLGGWAGVQLLDLYRDFFRFPDLPLVIPATAWSWSVVLTLAAALMGTAQALFGILRLSPARAMQGPPPPRYQSMRWVQRLEQALALPLEWRMILRQLRRHPWRSAFSILGVACAMALVVMGNFFRDAVDHIVARQFDAVWRGDVQVITFEPVGRGAMVSLQHLPNVPQTLGVEGSRSTAATLLVGHRSQRIQLRGLEPDAQQQRLLDLDGRVLELGDDALVLTDRLARKLGVRVGDEVLLRLVEAPEPWVRLRVTHLVAETMGMSATTTRATLNRLMQEGERFNAFSLKVPADALLPVLRALTHLPAVGGAFSKSHLLHNMQAITARNIRIVSSIMTGFALVLALGVVYNIARVALAERTWELASMRVLGLTQGEVARLMVGEQAVLLLLSIPLGLALGWWLVWGLSIGLRSDQFEFPVVVWPRTYALAVISVCMASMATGTLVWRRVHHLDMVAALKARE